MADFGQTDFGQFWCFSVLAKFSGVVVVVVVVVVLLFCVVVLCCCGKPVKTLNLASESGPALRGPTCSGFGVVVVVVVVVVAGLDFPGPPSAGPPSTGPPPPDRPKFRSFSSLSRHRFAVSVSLWGSSR